MKRLALTAALVLGLAAPAIADPLEGRWLTARDDNGNFGLIEVVPCGNALCGTLIQAYDSGGKQMESENVGRQIIWDTRPTGGSQYRGMVYSPDRDEEYESKLVLEGDKLSVSGCRRVLGVRACRQGGVWSRQ